MLINNAYAQQAGAAAGTASGTSQIIFMIAMFGILWFLMIRPQMKKAKEHKGMIEALQQGDEIITQGGVLGRITKLGDDNYLKVEIADGIEVHLQKSAVIAVLPKGSIDNV